MTTIQLKEVYRFQTAMGSTYIHYIDGSTKRYKTPHVGHNPNDKGWKEKSDWTVYLDEEDSLKVARHIHTSNTCVVFADRMVICGEYIEGTGWVMKHKFNYFRIPRTGLSPFEVTNVVLEPVGHRVRGWMHVGNKIVRMDD